MTPQLAIDGGAPVRDQRLPYGRQSISDDDIQAVVEVLRSDWLTTGPTVADFESAICQATGASHAVAVSSGTAALHASMAALGIGPADEVIVTPLTFAASANAVLYQGGRPVFADVDPQTLLLDPAAVEAAITPRTRALVAVDYAGQPADYAALGAIATAHNLTTIDDACHAIGGSAHGRRVGSLADLNTFSFHPVKHITTGEGGAITTDNAEWAAFMRHFRNHGITTDHHQREKSGSWFYEMTALGYNYRITDFQCALGMRQLDRLADFV
ncbi:MAG: DegT/DnrJ/EryC1/StrS family aminotransferase, partial [Anaerolineales bacterium]